MIKIEIKSEHVTERRIPSKRDPSQTILFREQHAYAYLFDETGQPKPYPQEIHVSLGDEQPAFKPGVYHLSPAAFYVDKYGGLSLGRLKLQPLVQASAKAA